MRTVSSRAGTLTAAALVAAFIGGCNRSSNPASSGGVPVGQPGGEVAAAKEAMKKISSAKSITEIGPHLSNRSAGTLGTVLLFPIGMMVGVAEMGDKLGKSLTSAGASAGAGADHDKKLEEVKQIKTELEALTKKYGIDDKSASQEAMAAKVEAKGRELFHDVAALYDKLTKAMGDKAGDLGMKPNDIAKDADKMEYTVVSPTEVKIVDKSAKSGDPHLRAVVEDGAWRIDFGGLNEMHSTGSSGGDSSPMGGGTSPSTGPNSNR